jgi:UDP-N-acetylglucosamine acyltransferase
MSGAPGTFVHATAVVHPAAHLEDGVRVGPYAVIAADVVIGAGTVIGSHAVIHDQVTIGRRNEIASHVVIGSRPQDRAYHGEPTRVHIGDENIISEFVSVDRATGEGHDTRVGNGAYIMSSVRISHNCRIGDGAVIVSGSQLGGWVEIGERAYLGGLAGVHQFVHIGRLAIVAGMSGARQDVPPYVMAVGFPARAVGLNTVGLRRHGVAPADRQALRRAFRIIFQSQLPMEEALAALEAEAADSMPVRHMLDFIIAARGRKRGIIRWQAAMMPSD